MSRLGKFRLSLSATVVAVALVTICAAWLTAAFDSGSAGKAIRGTIGKLVLPHSGDDEWVEVCLRSRLTILAGVIALVSATAAYLLCGTLLRLGRQRGPQTRSFAFGDPHRRPSRTSGQAGTAAIEFALVLPVALSIVLILMQSVMLVTGNLNVHYAAYAGARAAIVWVPEKVSYDEPRNVVADASVSAKMPRISAAAVYAMMPVSAGRRAAGGTGAAGSASAVQTGIERFYQLYGQQVPAWVRTMLAAKYEYAANHTEVTLDPPLAPPAYGDREDLRVHVRHTLFLSIPYAKRIFGTELPGSTGDYGVETRASYSLTNQGLEDEIDIEQFPRVVGRGG